VPQLTIPRISSAVIVTFFGFVQLALPVGALQGVVCNGFDCGTFRAEMLCEPPKEGRSMEWVEFDSLGSLISAPHLAD
jgi:hypothetical protein